MTDEQIKASNQNQNSRRWIGFCLLFAGGILLAQRSGIPLPVKIIFNWQVFLVIFGFVMGIKNRFRGSGWLLMMLVGGFFYVDSYYPAIAIHQYLWPIFLICAGLIVILRPRSGFKSRHLENWDYWKEKKQEWEQQYKDSVPLGDDYLDITTVLSGTRRNIVSKNFKGGEVVSILGGTELNFSQADINGRVELEVTQVLGGTKLIVPPHWDVRAEQVVSIFAGMEDRRPSGAGVVDPNKVLVLKGTSVFGGIDIRSY
jgi:hypothetical protein